MASSNRFEQNTKCKVVNTCFVYFFYTKLRTNGFRFHPSTSTENHKIRECSPPQISHNLFYLQLCAYYFHGSLQPLQSPLPENQIYTPSKQGRILSVSNIQIYYEKCFFFLFLKDKKNEAFDPGVCESVSLLVKSLHV